MRLLTGIIIINLILLPSPALSKTASEYIHGKIINGYYVETFTDLENLQKQRIDKRNQVEAIISNTYQANADSTYGILEAKSETSINSQEINWTVQKNQYQAKQVASNLTEFKYVSYSDGKIVRFKGGLVSSIENERVILDEVGNVGIRNTQNMQYNDKRLLTGYEATLKDSLGNISHISVSGIKYSPDSVFYGGYDTNANKNEMEKYIKETDSAGNVTLTHWQALSYDGKLLRAFHQDIEDSVYGNSSFTRSNITYENNDYQRISSYHEQGIGNDGLEYSSERSNISYNDKHLVTGYHEQIVTTQLDGNKLTTTVEAQFKYLPVPHQFGPDVETVDPDRLSESIITVRTLGSDGSEKTETTTTTYDYDTNQQLIGASGNSVFVGQEADWLDEETQTYKEGNKFSGTSQTQYEILFGRPMTLETRSHTLYYGHNISDNELLRIEDTTITYQNELRNHLPRTISTQEHTEITDPLRDPENAHKTTRDIATTYFYDNKGNLVDAQGEGTAQGYEYSDARGWYGEYTSVITIEYDVFLGKTVRTYYFEDKNLQGGV